MTEENWPGEWWKHCKCGHAWMFHDIEEMDDPNPTCCAEGCRCGQKDPKLSRTGES